MERDQLVAKVKANGAAWKSSLEKLAAEFPAQVKGVTGLGYMIGLVLQSEPPPYVVALREAGLLAPPAGGNTIRLLPPLVATTEELENATAIIRGVLASKAR
jgi:acetylornithine aminotransferase/acetylornithine/N-succinyldiaminopimelate aminotransferase